MTTVLICSTDLKAQCLRFLTFLSVHIVQQNQHRLEKNIWRFFHLLPALCIDSIAVSVILVDFDKSETSRLDDDEGGAFDNDNDDDDDDGDDYDN